MKNNNKVVIVTIILLLNMLLIGGCDGGIDCPYTLEERIVVDVLQVSAGSYGHNDKCLLDTNKGKLNLEGDVCMAQVGDIISQKIHEDKSCESIFDYWKIK